MQRFKQQRLLYFRHQMFSGLTVRGGAEDFNVLVTESAQ